jgi:hypothetical protein
MFRRLTGIVSSLLMLQLTFAASDLVCARHDGGSPTAHHHQSGHAATASADMHHSADAVESSKSCEVPVRSDCCAALASCGPSIGIAVATRAQEIRSIDLSIDAPTADSPASLTPAPEPPPPKA